jgi:hypothetical protein
VDLLICAKTNANNYWQIWNLLSPVSVSMACIGTTLPFSYLTFMENVNIQRFEELFTLCKELLKYLKRKTKQQKIKEIFNMESQITKDHRLLSNLKQPPQLPVIPTIKNCTHLNKAPDATSQQS